MSIFNTYPIEYVDGHEGDLLLTLREKRHLDSWKSWKESLEPDPTLTSEDRLWKALSHQGREIKALKQNKKDGPW